MIDKETLERMYVKENLKQYEIAAILKKAPSEVSTYIKKYGIKRKEVPPNYGLLWTKEQDEYLMEKFGVTSYKAIAKNVGRTVFGVKKRIKVLRLGNPLNNDECISQNQLAKILKSDAKTIRKWYKNYRFKMTKKNITNNLPSWRIKISDFWKWADKHKEKINWSKFKCGDLGAEPKWVMKARLDYDKPKRLSENWTMKEESLMISYYKAGVNSIQIAENLRRTAGSVRARLVMLGLRRVKPKIWSEAEKKKLEKFVNKGLSTKEIAVELDRTVSSITRGRSIFINKPKKLNL